MLSGAETQELSCSYSTYSTICAYVRQTANTRVYKCENKRLCVELCNRHITLDRSSLAIVGVSEEFFSADWETIFQTSGLRNSLKLECILVKFE